MKSLLSAPLAALSGLSATAACLVLLGGEGCSSRQVQTGLTDDDAGTDGSASVPVGTDSELCDHYAACVKAVGPRDGGAPGDASLSSGDAGLGQGGLCNRAREALFQSTPVTTCGCTFANECPGSTCDLATGECADSPRLLCKQYCGAAVYVDTCKAEDCAKFCGDYLPVVKEKCRPALDAFLACAQAEVVQPYRCATYILAPSFPVPVKCDAQYKLVSDCI